MNLAIALSASACLIFLGDTQCVMGGDGVRFVRQPGKTQVRIADEPVATYVYADPEILRPYFAHVHGPGGAQVTRNHPPVEGKDKNDHATMHPGIWMAFGDLDRSDFWRNRGRVIHEEFVEKPTASKGQGRFVVRNRYVATGDAERIVCRETAGYTFLVRPEGYLLIWDSTFSAEHVFSFGDQEEMGLGIRVATPITVASGGTILDAQGRRNGREVWGNASAWCDYSGTTGGRRVGVTLFCHPQNFRPSWFHARDYGLLVANPFGRKAFGKGEPSNVDVRPRETLRLRYGILLHSGPERSRPDLQAAYADYLNLTGK